MVSLSLDIIFRQLVIDAYESMYPSVVKPGAVGMMRAALGGVSSLAMQGLKLVPSVVTPVGAAFNSLPAWCGPLIGGAVGIAGLKLYENRAAMSGLMEKTLVSVKNYPPVIYGMVAKTDQHLLESRKPGSTEKDLTANRAQCQIGEIRDGAFVVHGNAIRFDDGYLVGPDHVLSKNNVSARGSQGIVSLEGKERILLATDLTAIKLTEREFSSIGVAVAKIGVDSGRVYAQVVGPLGQGTTGDLTHDDSRFGCVVYDGTTLPGYSGSAYCVGPQIYGMHTRGGTVNGGYSASYIWALIRSYTGQILESSEDWLTREVNKAQRVRWSKHGSRKDHAFVFVQGRYEEHSDIVLSKVLGEDWTKQHDWAPSKDNPRQRGYKDSLESGEASSLKSGGSSGMVTPQQQQDQNLLKLMRMFSQCSNKRLESVQSLLQAADVANNSSGQAK